MKKATHWLKIILLFLTFSIASNSVIADVKFPITQSAHNNVVGNSGAMATNVTINSSGELRATTNTWTKVKLKGFTGGVGVVLMDENKNYLWYSDWHSFGVDGCYVGRCNRHDNWEENVPVSVLNDVRFIAIHQQHSPRGRFIEWINSPEGRSTITTIAMVVALF